MWRHLLSYYPDNQVCDFLEFGWPINYCAITRPVVPVQTHRSAYMFATAVDNDIAKDIQIGAIIGPLKKNPFDTDITISPLQTVSKLDVKYGRRVVVDLSFPEGSSVNDGIPKDTYLDQPTNLHFPSVDTLAEIVRQKGRGALMLKKDLKSAYKQLPVCPGDWPLCAISWSNSLFVYIREMFGLRTSALACQRTTSCVTYLFAKAGYHCCNYLDDFGGADTPDRAQLAYQMLELLLQKLNLWENTQKAALPSTSMTFLGIQLDSTNFTLTIPPDKLKAARELLHSWSLKSAMSKTDIQSLLGTLQHLCCCIRGGRIFLNRMLNTLRSMNQSQRSYQLDSEFRRDLFWWETFLDTFNGVSIMQELHWSQPDDIFASDACLSGAGGFSDGRYFRVQFPTHLQHLHINALEMLVIIICCKLWEATWGGKRIRCPCDNMSSVMIINTSRSRDPFLQTCIRELWFLASTFSVELRAVHISGLDNRIPDHLSRWCADPRHQTEFVKLTQDYTLIEESVSLNMFNFTHPW